MLTDLTLICHAPTRATRAAAFPMDEPIEPQAQAHFDAARRGIGRDVRAFVSPALRARQTAEALGLVAVADAALAECDYGRWAGRLAAEVGAAEPAVFAAWLDDPAAAPHGGESLGLLQARVAAWLDARSREAGRVVAVTHAGVIRAALVHALDAGPAAFRRIDVAPLAHVRLRSDGRRWTLHVERPRA